MNPFLYEGEKRNEDIRVDQLSAGEKYTLALFGDLARRIVISNQYRADPLEGEGNVLIDEIELHMYPSWQRRVLKILSETFPNIQFIVTIHFPQVLGEADDNYNIVFLNWGENGCTVEIVERMDGFDNNLFWKNIWVSHPKMKKQKE